MIITAIEYGEGKKYKVYLNDAFAFELYKSEIKSCGLETGQELEEELYEKILYEVIGRRVKKRAMHILEKHDKTEQQLREKLREGRYPSESIESAIEYVKSYGYVDDISYAKRYVEYRIKKKSKKQLKMELMGKGISSEIISQVLEEMDDFELGTIKKLIIKKCPFPTEISSEEKNKLKMSLMRKGFPYSEIDRAFYQLEDGEGILEIT